MLIFLQEFIKNQSLKGRAKPQSQTGECGKGPHQSSSSEQPGKEKGVKILYIISTCVYCREHISSWTLNQMQTGLKCFCSTETSLDRRGFKTHALKHTCCFPYVYCTNSVNVNSDVTHDKLLQQSTAHHCCR